jgi:hypothetical protein
MIDDDIRGKIAAAQLSGEFDRFADDLVFVAYEAYQPNTIHALLAHVHFDDVPRPKREAAIRAWVCERPPGAR